MKKSDNQMDDSLKEKKHFFFFRRKNLSLSLPQLPSLSLSLIFQRSKTKQNNL